jgi:hypothetical protein
MKALRGGNGQRSVMTESVCVGRETHRNILSFRSIPRLAPFRIEHFLKLFHNFLSPGGKVE